MASVVLKFGERVLREIPLEKPEVTIGRNPACDIHIDNLAVSSSHARIAREGEKFFVEDLGSLNGTFLDGKRIEREELAEGASVTVGKHTLVFMPEKAEEEEPGHEPAHRAPAPPMFEETMILQTARHREMSGAVPTPKPPPGGRVGVLRVVQGASEGNEHELRDWFATIGKGEAADIKLKGFFAPEIAALLQRTEEGGYFISPPEKGRKPRLNGQKVKEGTPLREGDVVEAGGVRMVFFIREARQD